MSGPSVPRCAEPTLQGGDHRGFTLVEVLVALTIGALVVLVAHQVVGGVADQGKTLTAGREALDRRANARRWLQATFLSLDVGTDGATGFDGRPDHVAFTTWLLTPDGWFERRHVVLDREGERLVAIVMPERSIALVDSVSDVQLDYLLEPGAESRWVREWVSSESAPGAVRARVVRMGTAKGDEGRVVVDTLLFLIKARG
jgi:prepilin-type N-terminal cleavage/methylation domain-containing protein